MKKISSILNLDEPIFVGGLGEIHDTIEEVNIEDELVTHENGMEMGQAENDVWDPEATADEMVNM